MLQFKQEGIYCVPGGFYIDPWRPVDLAIVTHGHADHAHRGMKKYLCHHFSVPILKSRIGASIAIQGVAYAEPVYINNVKVTLHPAGHIVGSAQIRMEYRGQVAVVSGDYKLQDDGLSTPFEPVKCHTFVSESTFGLPIYNWIPVVQQNQQLQNWVVENQKNGKTSVFIGYSLGKAQRIMQGLQDVAPLYVHGSIAKLNEAYESAGLELPSYQPLNFQEDIKHINKGVVIVPPALADSKAIRKVPNPASAICSGWMQVRGARRWRSADAGFAISDHADWQGLLTAVRSTEAEMVYVTHGQTAVFTRYLNEIGIQAEEVKTAFGEDEEAEETETL